jgi:hypothetical protein
MTHVHEDIGAFILGALDTDAEKRVREHLATCQECAAAHAELAGIPGLLDLAVITGATEDEPLPPAIEERLLDRFARERIEKPSRRRWRPRLALGLSSALAGAAIAVATLVVGLDFQKNAGRPTSQYRLAFEKVGNAPVSASARAGLRTTESGTVVRLWVKGLPSGDVYEVWCDAPGWSASAGTFRADSHGSAYVVLNTAARRGEYDAIRVVRRSRSSETDVLQAKL